MTPDAMLQMLTQPEMLRQVSLEDLRRTVEAYPCFALPRMLYVKALKDRGDLDYPQELFKASLQAPSRRQLYFCIQGRRFMQQPAGTSYVDTYITPLGTASDDSEANAGVSDGGFSLIDKFLEEQPVDSQATVRDIPMEEVAVYDIEEALGDGKDVVEDNEIIRRFLEGESGSMPENDDDGQPLSSSAEIDVPVIPEAAFTLTLARIYLKQKKYDQALEIFRSLVLKNPEKSIYFAAQIRYLEKVINNLNQ